MIDQPLTATLLHPTAPPRETHRGFAIYELLGRKLSGILRREWAELRSVVEMIFFWGGVGRDMVAHIIGAPLFSLLNCSEMYVFNNKNVFLNKYSGSCSVPSTPPPRAYVTAVGVSPIHFCSLSYYYFVYCLFNFNFCMNSVFRIMNTKPLLLL